jgi:multimeric flavodoxin WrbA
MKILAISASPRKGGNSDVLCDQFLKGAGEAGHETEKISLSDKRLNPCTGCYGCGKTNACVIQDDMAEILQKLIEADVVVLATPVYFYSMDAQMKMMIDRCLPRYKEITNKEFYLIVTAADPQHSAADETIAGLRGVFAMSARCKRKRNHLWHRNMG